MDERAAADADLRRTRAELDAVRSREDLFRKEIRLLNEQLEKQGARVSAALYEVALKEVEELEGRVRGMEIEREGLTPRKKRRPTEQKKAKAAWTPMHDKQPAPIPQPKTNQKPLATPRRASTPPTPLSAHGGRLALAARLKSMRSTGKKPPAPSPANKAVLSSSGKVGIVDRKKSPALNAAFMASKQRKLYRIRKKAAASTPTRGLGEDFGKENI